MSTWPLITMLTTYSLVHSHLTYCQRILRCTCNNNINCVSKVQKKAIRIIDHSHYNEHTEPLFISLPYDETLEWSKLIFIHCIDYSYALCTAFANAWPKNNERYMGMPFAIKMIMSYPFPE
jgi:hypothetical protein